MFTFAQISDFHIAMPGATADRVFQTAAHLRVAVAHLNNLPQPPEIVLCTGDLVDGGGAGEYAILADILAGLAMPFFLIPGNHDNRDAMRRAFPSHQYLVGHEGFIQYTVEDWPPRLIALDTLIPGRAGGRLCEQRLAWLAARLAEQPGRPTVLFMHHPPFRAGQAMMDNMGLEDHAALAAVIDRHDRVEAVLAGHLHRHITRRFAGTIAMTAPATGHQIALDLSGKERLRIVMEPPAALLHVWLGDDDGGLVSHVVYTGDGYDDLEIYDGKGWITGHEPPTPAIPL